MCVSKSEIIQFIFVSLRGNQKYVSDQKKYLY